MGEPRGDERLCEEHAFDGLHAVREGLSVAVPVLGIAYAALLFAGLGGFNPLPSPL